MLVLQRVHSGDVCDLASTLRKYDLRKGDLFVLSWEMVQRVRWGRIYSELLMCGGGVWSILLFPLVARCLETIDVCIWNMFVFMSVVVTVGGGVCGNVCYVSAIVENSVFLVHHHYAPLCNTHTTHIISSTAPTYAPHCDLWICGQTPPG